MGSDISPGYCSTHVYILVVFTHNALRCIHNNQPTFQANKLSSTLTLTHNQSIMHTCNPSHSHMQIETEGQKRSWGHNIGHQKNSPFYVNTLRKSLVDNLVQNQFCLIRVHYKFIYMYNELWYADTINKVAEDIKSSFSINRQTCFSFVNRVQISTSLLT